MPGGDAAEAAPPRPPLRGEVEAALVKSRRVDSVDRIGPKAGLPRLRIVLLADQKDHGVEEHDYPLWQERWARLLGGPGAANASQANLFGPPSPGEDDLAGGDHTEVIRARGWPTESQWAGADVVMAYCYLPWTQARTEELKRWLQGGGGLVLIHSATWTRPGPDPVVGGLVGVGGFTHYRHGPVVLRLTDREHPICQGLPERISFYDETYWPPTPPLDPARVNVLATSIEADGADADRASPQPMFWTTEVGRGRIVGCALGHFTWTFDDPWFRLLILRGVAWAAGQPVERLEGLVLRGARVAER